MRRRTSWASNEVVHTPGVAWADSDADFTLVSRRQTRRNSENTVVASYLHRHRPLRVVHPPHPLAWRERHSFRRLPAASCSYVGFAYRTVDAFVADPPKNDELDDDLAFAESLPPLPPPPEPAAASFF